MTTLFVVYFITVIIYCCYFSFSTLFRLPRPSRQSSLSRNSECLLLQLQNQSSDWDTVNWDSKKQQQQQQQQKKILIFSVTVNRILKKKKKKNKKNKILIKIFWFMLISTINISLLWNSKKGEKNAKMNSHCA